MQRRPPTHRSIQAHVEAERELTAERANALGRAGLRLEEAIDDWRLLVEVGHASAAEVDQALSAVRDAAWALIVQRECAGFVADNLRTVRRHYDIPDEVLRRL